MRIFTGIKLADEPKERILKELLPFKKADTPIRWTGCDNIHLTLKFIGEVDASLAMKAGEALAASQIAVAPFRLRLNGFGKFPAGEDLRVFWAGVEESPQLGALFAGVETALQPLGIERETRPFHPHVTLGRNKAPSMRGDAAPSMRGGAAPSMRGDAACFDFKELISLLQQKGDLFLGEWPVAAFQLFSSRLAPASLSGTASERGGTAFRAGPIYHVLKEIPLVQS